MAVGGGLHDDRMPSQPPEPEPSWRGHFREIVFLGLILLMFIFALRVMPLPTVLMLSHLAAIVVGVIIGWNGHKNEKINRLGRFR